MRAGVQAVFVAAGLACTPAPTRTPQEPAVAAEPVAKPVVVAAADEPSCVTAECWTDQADAALARGDVDVAASGRGQAFLADPSLPRLTTWIDELAAGGEVRRARDGLAAARAVGERRGDAALVAEVARRLAALPASGPRAIAPAALTDELRAAYTDAAEGRLDAAAAGFAATSEPYHRVSAGDVQLRRGDEVAARRMWAAARSGFHERGAALRLEPVEKWFTQTVAWRGEQLALMKLWSLLAEVQESVGVLQLRSPVAGAAWRRLYFPKTSQVVAFTDDGLGFLRDEDGTIVQQDLLSGAITRKVATPGGRISALLSSGTGDDLRVLCSGEHGVTLWDARGGLVEGFSLTGTTPTILRRYTGEGTYHDNILRDSPTWPVALAMTTKAGLVAVGGSDSKVRVFDRVADKQRELAFQWDYVERRPMGANPDLNLPLAMRFDAKERLVVVHTKGDILVWDPRTGKQLQHHAGRCTQAEAVMHVNRYAEAGAPRQQPTAEQIVGCGHATQAAISPDGSTVVTGGGLSGFRVRSVADGRSLAYVAAGDLPDGYFAVSAAGTLGMADLYGATAVWRPGMAAVERLDVHGPSTTISPWLSGDGRILHFAVAQQDHVWDLATRTQLAVTRAPKEQILAISGDGRRAAVRTPAGIEVREVATGKTVFTQAVVAGTSVDARATRSGHVLFNLSNAPGQVSLVIVAPDGTSTTQMLADDVPIAASDDGHWLATGWPQGPIKVWNLRAAGRVVHTLDAHRHIAFSRDGKQMAYVVEGDRDKPQFTVRVQAVEGPPALRERTFTGWPELPEFTPDGSELLVVRQTGKLTRWRLATDETTSLEQVSLIPAKRVTLADDGKTLRVLGYDHVQIRTNDATMRRIATLYPLQTGGWVVVSTAGAVDGSDDAVDSMVTRVTADDAALVFSGRLGWDAAHVAGTATRALDGSDVVPPLLVRPAPPPEQALE